MIPSDLSTELRPIAQEAHRIHESALYSAQGQFESAKLWRAVNYLLGAPAAILAAISGGTGLHNPGNGTVPAILALLAAVFGTALTTLNPSRRMTHAQSSANAYLALQTKARQLLTIDIVNMENNEAREVLKQLTIARDELNNTADPPSSYARWRAQRNIKRSGQNYEVDKEN